MVRRVAAAVFGAGLAGGAAAACGNATFACESDVECSGGLCHTGYCAFPDDTCASGSRWGQHASSLSSKCVPAGGSESGFVTSDDDSTGSPEGTTTSGAVGDTLSLDSTASSSTGVVGTSGESTVGTESTGAGSTTAMPPSIEPIGHWTMDDGSGLLASDISGLDNPGVLNGGAMWTQGVVDGAVALDGVDGHVEVEVRPEYLLDSQVTMAAWVRVEGTSPVAHPSVVELRESYALRLDGSSTSVSLLISDSDADQANMFGNVACIGDELPMSEWVHIAATYDSADRTLRTYVNGTVVCETTTTGGDGLIDPTNEPFHLGRRNTNPSAYFAGAIDDVRLYDVALTSSEIADLLGP